MKKIAIISGFVLIVASTLLIYSNNHQASDLTLKTESQPAIPVSKATQNFLNLLDQDLKAQATFPFEAEERLNWHFVPKSRKGLPLRDMNNKQKDAAFDILKASLSEQGFKKSQGVIELEAILRELEGRGPDDDYRDPGKYYFSIFGNPSDEEPWGWRVEGHHLSLNFSSITNEVVSGTPSFFGANPAIVHEGPKKGWQLLDREIQLAADLLHSFSQAQKEKVLLADETFGDIVSGNDRKVALGEIKGLAMSEMDKNQQTLLRHLLDVYIQNFKPDLAEKLMENIRKAGMEKLHFAWAGSTTLEDYNYYRIHSPAILIEYDNSQDNANHVHSVVRDLNNDFGRDALQEHYAEHPH